ncbi:MAG TPA: hypothetical protein VLM89_17790 [Phycisphaerae bacterium]|nr:hypothetical protein [Phycisphaerae bacterium]
MTMAHRSMASFVVGAILVGSVGNAQTQPTASSQPSSYDYRAHIRNDVQELAELVDSANWPRTSTLRTAPKIDKSLLSTESVSKVTKDFSNYSIAYDTQCADGYWTWRRIVTLPPVDLPEDKKLALLKAIQKLPPNRRNDPQFVEQRLAISREMHNKNRGFEGDIQVRMNVTTGSASAIDLMLTHASNSNAPIIARATRYADKNRINDLGTIGFSETHPDGNTQAIWIRDNILVRVNGSGVFAGEALPLAHRIDDRILQQLALTKEQWLARKPTAVINDRATKIQEAISGQNDVIPYTLFLPPGQEVVEAYAMLDGNRTSARDGKIVMGNRHLQMGESIHVKLVIITSELMANVIEKDVAGE